MLKNAATIFLLSVLLCTGAVLNPRYAAAQVGCSEQDQRVFEAYMQQFQRAVMSGNFQLINQLNQKLASTLSPDCRTALAQLPQGQMPTPGGDVFDHGGGKYGYGGVTCDPSGGCIGPE